MIFIGFLIGVVAGVFSGVLFHTVFFPVQGWLFVLWLLVNFIVAIIIYAIGRQGYSSAGYDPTNLVNGHFIFERSDTEKFAFGTFVGINAAANFVILFMLTGINFSFFVSFLALIPILVLSSTLAQSRVVQTLIGWTVWFMPLALLGGVVGIFISIFAIPAGIVQNGQSALRIDPTSGAFEIHLDMPGFMSGTRGFSIWIFTYINTATSGPTPVFSTGFLTGSVSAHETGHTLNTGIFGSFFLLVNWIDQNFILPQTESHFALAELYAESRAPVTPVAVNSYLPIWSP